MVRNSGSAGFFREIVNLNQASRFSRVPMVDVPFVEKETHFRSEIATEMISDASPETGQYLFMGLSQKRGTPTISDLPLISLRNPEKGTKAMKTHPKTTLPRFCLMNSGRLSHLRLPGTANPRGKCAGPFLLLLHLLKSLAKKKQPYFQQ